MELAKGDLRGIDFAHIEAVLRLARSGPGHGRVEARGLEIARSFDWVRFSRPSPNGRNTATYAVPVTVPGIVEVPGSGLAISLEILDKAETSAMPEYVYNREMGCIDWPSVSGPLEPRNWRPGDRYQPSGHTGEEKIKNLFQKHRVPLWERSGWPVLTDGSGIIWSRKFGPSAGLVPGKIAGPVLRIREIVNLESEMPVRASIDIR
jgi:tRNA(Ile)-lysidine synthase